MYAKSITYTDFDGNEQTETFYFNLTKAELVELEVSVDGGFAALLKSIAESSDGQTIIGYFKKIILMAYGKKSLDGRRFVKSQELRDEFEQMNAYSELFMELATNADSAALFMNSIVPADLRSNKNQLEIPNITKRPEVIPLPAPTERDLTGMSKEELIEELRRRNEQ